MVTWNSSFLASPANGDNPSAGASKIRETRTEVGARAVKEHEWSGTSTDDGPHKEGSAKVYLTTAIPTYRPDGVTAFTTADKGRSWLRTLPRTSTASVSSGLALMIHNGTRFVSTGVTLSTAQTIHGKKTFVGGGFFPTSVKTAKASIILTTTTARHGAISALLSGCIPLSNDSIVVSGEGIQISSNAGIIFEGRVAYGKALRSTTGIKYLVGIYRQIGFKSTSTISEGNLTTIFPYGPTADITTKAAYKVSTGTVSWNGADHGLILGW